MTTPMLPFEHGTNHRYQNGGCRCRPCRDAHNAAQRATRAYRKANGICQQCSEPVNGLALCARHNAQHIERQKRKRQRVAAAKGRTVRARKEVAPPTSRSKRMADLETARIEAQLQAMEQRQRAMRNWRRFAAASQAS